MQNLHLTAVTIDGVSFTGLEGCVRYKADPEAALSTQDEYHRLIAELPPADVLMTHCPPAESMTTTILPMSVSTHSTSGYDRPRPRC